MNYGMKLVGAAAVSFMMASFSAGAATLTFAKVIPDGTTSGNSSSDASSQIQVEVLEFDNGGTLGASFHISAVAGTVSDFSIAEIYWSDISGLFVPPPIELDSTGGIDTAPVKFSEGSASPPDLPSGGTAIPPFTVTAGLLADADPGPGGNANAIQIGEFYKAFLAYDTGVTFADVIADLKDGDLRMGVHVRAHPDGESDSYVGGGCIGPDCLPGTGPDPIPLPAGLPLMLTAIGIGAYMRKRARKSA